MSELTKKKTDAGAIQTVDSEVQRMREQAMAEAGADSIIVPVLHLYQGVPDERKKYGDHKPGQYIDCMTMEPIPDGESVVPVRVRPYKAAWYDRNSNKNEGYPLAEWGPNEPRPERDRDGNPLPWDDPELYECEHLDLFLLVGDRAVPHLYRAKSTTLNGVKTLNTLEAERVGLQRRPGAYGLDTRVRDGKKGESLMPFFRPLGDCSDAAMGRWVPAYKMVMAGGFKVAESADEQKVDEIPI